LDGYCKDFDGSGEEGFFSGAEKRVATLSTVSFTKPTR